MQRRLLDVQAFDLRLDQLAHRRATVPEKRTVDELTAERDQLANQRVQIDTEVGDLGREQRKAEADVEQVRNRKARNEQLMQAGNVASAKELENLQHEVQTLTRRQSELEDVELEIMERLEQATERQREVGERTEAAQTELAQAEQALADAYRKIDDEARQVTAERAEAASEVDEPLLAMYQRLREQHGGIGAAELRRGRCEGCRMELDATFMTQLRSVAPDEIVRCEECRRILVRTPESGL